MNDYFIFIIIHLVHNQSIPVSLATSKNSKMRHWMNLIRPDIMFIIISMVACITVGATQPVLAVLILQILAVSSNLINTK